MALVNSQTMLRRPNQYCFTEPFNLEDSSMKLSDLYAYLQHDSGFSVLLNQPGRDNSHPGGYGDNGFSIVLDELAANDVHTYRANLGGPFPLTSPLGGTWKPDGRKTDPANVGTGDPRKRGTRCVSRS